MTAPTLSAAIPTSDLAFAVKMVGMGTPGVWEITHNPFDKSLGDNWRIAECGGASDDSGNCVYVTAPIMDYCQPAELDAAAIIASRNFIWEHGDELLAVLAEARDRVKWDQMTSESEADTARLTALLHRIDRLTAAGGGG